MGNHNLGFDVPEQRLQSRGSFDLRPKSIENWLTNLPRANIGMMAKQVYDLLTESNRVIMAPAERQQLLQQLCEPIDYLLEAMEKHYIGLSLPLPSKNKKISLLAQNLLHEFVIAHKCAILDTLNEHKVRYHRRQLAMLMHNHLAFNNRLLKCLNLTYNTVPSSFWREQCLIFQYAEQLSISEVAVFGNSSPWSVLNRFKQAILLTLSAPYSLAQQEIQQLNSQLTDWVSSCRLLNMSQYTPGQHTQFINLNSDKGPQHCEQLTEFDDGWRIIDTSEITPILENEISQIQHKLTSMHLQKETLQRVHKQMSTGQRRQFNRTSKPDTFTLAIGTSAIHWMLSHHTHSAEKKIEQPASYQSSLVRSVEFTDAPDVWNVYRDASTTRPLGQSDLNQPIEYKTYDFNVINESANGFQLHLKEYQQTIGLKVGELISLHKGFNGSGQQFGLAHIRWIHQISAEELIIGVELLAPDAIPVEVSLQQKENQKIESAPLMMRALLLPALPAMKQAATLIAPDTFKAGQEILLHQNDITNTIRLTHISNQCCSHAQFQFDVLKSQPKPTDNAQAETPDKDDDDDLENVWELL